MTRERPQPTPQQQIVIGHDGSAFIRACPGAGKTMVLAERAHRLLRNMPPGRGIAFLSFTQAAIFELDLRLREMAVLRSPVFPSFVGTFDSFVWSFLVAPFGLRESDARPRLVADIGEFDVRPYERAQALPLSCFESLTDEIRPAAAKQRGFDVSQKRLPQVRAYETAAKRLRRGLREKGYVGFEEARLEALGRLNDAGLSSRIAGALAGRFDEVIVDEAQDCNPDDLKIISWLRSTGIPVKVVCDPDQAIYGFRGGVTDHLAAFAATFSSHERLELSGNFRSSPNVCKAIVQFRPLDGRGTHDRPLGQHAEDVTPIYVLKYHGSSVPKAIGEKLCETLRQLDIEVSDCPVVAATKASAAAAIGQRLARRTQERAVRLADAVTSFHFASDFSDLRTALERAHELFLDLEGHLMGMSYHQYLSDKEVEPLTWRPQVMKILRELGFDPTKHKDARGWHSAAKDVLERCLSLRDGPSISQSLRWSSAVEGALIAGPRDTVVARTIHSVKGMEFPAICVVTTSSTLKGILDFLERGTRPEMAEEARKLYVAISRARQLLVVASPKSQASRLAAHLRGHGANVKSIECVS